MGKNWPHDCERTTNIDYSRNKGWRRVLAWFWSHLPGPWLFPRRGGCLVGISGQQRQSVSADCRWGWQKGPELTLHLKPPGVEDIWPCLWSLMRANIEGRRGSLFQIAAISSLDIWWDFSSFFRRPRKCRSKSSWGSSCMWWCLRGSLPALFECTHLSSWARCRPPCRLRRRWGICLPGLLECPWGLSWPLGWPWWTLRRLLVSTSRRWWRKFAARVNFEVAEVQGQKKVW